LPNVERSWLQKIINDAGSTEEEREEAKRQLEDTDTLLQRDQDRLLERYLDLAIEREEYVQIPEATIELCHALGYWIAGIGLDKMDTYVDLLTALHGRTLSPLLKEKSRAAIQGWLKLAKYYPEWPGAEKAARHANQFLESLRRKDRL